MPHATLDRSRTQADLIRLEELLAAIQQYKGKHAEVDELSLLAEHLASARIYLQGAMPDEYADTLEMALTPARRLHDRKLRHALEGSLRFLLEDVAHNDAAHHTGWHHYAHHRHHHDPPLSATSPLWTFFSPSDNAFGSFRPNHHIIAAFPSPEAAIEAANILGQRGFDEEEMITADGPEMLKFLEEFHRQAGAWGMLMGRLSRAFGTEETFVDRDIHDAKQGAGFLAVNCPVAQEAELIRDALLFLRPISMRRYLAAGIQSLI